MKIGIAQINTKLGDVPANTQKIKDVIDAIGAESEVIVFPEMTLPGYPLHDRIYDKNLLKAQRAALDTIQAYIAATQQELKVILGFIDFDANRTGPDGKWIKRNAAAILDGKTMDVYHKKLLPTYDVFYDKRYFQPGELTTRFTLPHKEVGAVTICEDMWSEGYDSNPVEEAMSSAKMQISLALSTNSHVVEKGIVTTEEEVRSGTFKKTPAPFQLTPTVLFNISSSPYSIGKIERRLDIINDLMRHTWRPFVYVNQVGGQDGHVYDGHSMIVDALGKVIFFGKGFEEQVTVVDTEQPTAGLNEQVRQESRDTYGNILAAIKLGTKDFLQKVGIKDVVIGVSGGIDSAVSLYILSQILPKERIHAYYLPSKHSQSLGYVEELCGNLGIDFQSISIDSTVQASIAETEKVTGEKVTGLAYENIQAQVRGVKLMTLSRMCGGVVINNSNRTEIAQGYATMYGDTIGFMSIIGDLLKTEVYGLANYINEQADSPAIPESIIKRVASAELTDNQKDPFDYFRPGVCEGIDALFNGEDAEEVAQKFNLTTEEVAWYLKNIDRNEFKRKQSPTVIKLKNPSVGGGGRLYPIVYG